MPVRNFHKDQVPCS